MTSGGSHSSEGEGRKKEMDGHESELIVMQSIEPWAAAKKKTLS
jgi:hypothetical protein